VPVMAPRGGMLRLELTFLYLASEGGCPKIVGHDAHEKLGVFVESSG
jgi:hypothetical protein